MGARTHAPVLTLSAPGKINLCLHVVGRRHDGYHLLESLAGFTALGDTLAFAPAEALTLERSGPEVGGLPAPDDDLILRAARALAEAAGIEALARIKHIKRLPIGGGLGGGSSDAATTLIGLARLWRVDLMRVDLAKLAERLGADVPMCLMRRAAVMRGVGEALSPVALPSAPLLLVNPRRPAPTAEVFRRYAAGARLGEARHLPALTPPPRDARALAAQLAGSGNDLTLAAVEIVPAIGAILAALERLPGCLLARMSGSGATCFGIFADAVGLRQAARALGANHPEWWQAPTELVSDARV
ncbi:MAG: 4-(cytidine 5'-diphospho)-2-C-methyl-D-erythritol kinase [Alphaproteobacteria bacterium]|nr:4-(cytidine 5'-diphospho)-2-C-methyl-D-erythritol kinase [Alphaproteobacteria bacterium]